MRSVIAYNPAAGRLPSRFLVEHAAQILEKNGWSIEVICAHSGQHITQLARDATAAKMDAFLWLERTA